MGNRHSKKKKNFQETFFSAVPVPKEVFDFHLILADKY